MQVLIDRLGAARLRVLRELFLFGVVGTIGFVIDASVLSLAMMLGAGPYSGRVLSYIAAASGTYALNRLWTFRDRGGDAPVARQWALFLLVNLVGFACNYGTYAALVTWVTVVQQHPVLGVAAGSLAGLVGNFLLSRRYVFRAPSNTAG